MKFSVGYNPHYSFVEHRPFVSAVAFDQVQEVFFSYPGERSGRAVQCFSPLPGLSAADMKAKQTEDLLAVRGAGKELNLVLNGGCYGDMSGTMELADHIFDLIESLANDGLKPDSVTTAQAFVAKVLKSAFPEIRTRASIIFNLRDRRSFEYMAQVMDEYYISPNENRNLKNVEYVSDWCRANGKKLYMLVNSRCLANCPFMMADYTSMAHSAEMEGKNRHFNPVNMGLCEIARKRDTVLADTVKATWIRPEDVSRFEGLVDGMKISTRTGNSVDTAVKAYVSGVSPDNLCEIFDGPIMQPYTNLDIRINSRGIPPDFLDRVADCGRRCDGCGYCDRLAEKIGRIPD